MFTGSGLLIDEHLHLPPSPMGFGSTQDPTGQEDSNHVGNDTLFGKARAT